MIEAVVQTGLVETSYRRAGVGEPVLILAGRTEREAGDWLFGQLAERFRTIAPVLPGEGELEAWLRGLIDGLGLDRPAVVAATALGAGLLRFMALDPGRAGRIALFNSLPLDGVGPTHGELDEPVPAVPHPFVVVRLPGPGDPEGRMAAVDRLVRFLATSPGAQAGTAAFRLS
jgi:hypothetical protein